MANDVESLAFDTWGVDYGIIGADGELKGLPVCYRDTRTKNAPEKYSKISPERLYSLTGNQIMNINTLFQLSVEDKDGDMFLFMPDLFAYALCFVKSAEQTIASTSQMLDLEKVSWQKRLCSFG